MTCRKAASGHLIELPRRVLPYFSDKRNLRALSIRQPYAELILRGLKLIVRRICRPI
jgi:hypothetical protein